MSVLTLSSPPASPSLELATASVVPPAIGARTLEPSPSQRSAIEAAPQSLLVLAGPGAGKTYCLTERIRFLIEHHGVDPARICAFTFTNKAAGEIAHRLEGRLGEAASHISRGTLHAFCAERLREHGVEVGLTEGFGIADEAYQLAVLRRLEGYRPWHKRTLTGFSAHRFRRDPLRHNDIALFDRYEKFLADRKVVDFDMLVLKAAELLERTEAAGAIRSRWDVVLVDEFQDLNPVQYRVVKALARDHRHVFAVGDDEQSIYSWAGADPAVFKSFVNDFGLTDRVHLEENRRCPHDVFALARRLVQINVPIFTDRRVPRAARRSEFPIETRRFETDDDEAAWLVHDLRRDRATHGHAWGDVALLYRTHDIGNRLESALLNAGIPCRLAQGRALADDPVVGFVIAAVRVIAWPRDDLCRDAFFRVMLPEQLYDEAQTWAEKSKRNLRQQLHQMALQLPKADASGKQIRRALADWRNLIAVGRQQPSLLALVHELLSRRVGSVIPVLDARHDELSDPASSPEVVQLAARLRSARERRVAIWLPPLNGVDIALKGLLVAVGFADVRRGGTPPRGAERLGPDDAPSLGLPLAVFKAAQLIEMGEAPAAFSNFTAIDLETTSLDPKTAEIIEIAAVRVRDGVIVDRWSSLVKPERPITADAKHVHGIGDAEVAAARRFADVWPDFRSFCGGDVIVAHNGHTFDFPVLRRMALALGFSFDLTRYDSLPLARDLSPASAKLVDLARHFGIPVGRAHRALDDTMTLASVFLALRQLKLSRARKTALDSQLDFLGVALALSDDASLCAEARACRDIARPYALGRYSNCLDWYEREQGDDASVPSVDEVIERLGGSALMLRIRTGKSAEERYPAAMMRLRRLIADLPDLPFDAQLSTFLERAALSRWEGEEPERLRVNLLTMHSTKGLEFSRVYVVGVEDGQLLLGSPTTGPSAQEIEEARRLLYVGMTRTIDRLVLTHVVTRGGKATGGQQFLEEMGLAEAAVAPAIRSRPDDVASAHP